MTPFAKESDFEAAVVLELRQRGWGAAEVIRNPSEADLLANWAQILFENNRGRDRLNEVPPGTKECRLGPKGQTL